MTEQQRETAVDTAVGVGAGEQVGYAWSQYMAGKKAQMEQATAATGVQVTQTADNRLELNAPNDISFAANSAEIQPQLRPVLDPFAAGRLGRQRGPEITIVGHTDSTGNDAINDLLSLARAGSVRLYLTQRGVNRGADPYRKTRFAATHRQQRHAGRPGAQLPGRDLSGAAPGLIPIPAQKQKTVRAEPVEAMRPGFDRLSQSGQE